MRTMLVLLVFNACWFYFLGAVIGDCALTDSQCVMHAIHMGL